jgi:hypothetical protein
MEAPAMTRDIPDHVNPIQWQQAVGVARQISARVFRDGGTPAEALASVGGQSDSEMTWEKAVDLMAAELCIHPLSQALSRAA